MVIVMMAIASASRPDSTIPLTNAHLSGQNAHLSGQWDIRKPYRKPLLPARKVRRWSGIFEHRDTYWPTASNNGRQLVLKCGKHTS